MNIEEIDDIRSKIDLGLWKQVFRFALNHKPLLITLSISAITIAICDALFPFSTKMAIDIIQNPTANQSLLRPIIFFASLTITLCIGVHIFIKCAGSISYHVSHDIKTASFKRLQELEFAYYDGQPTGWLISRLTADCDRLSRIISWGFLDIVWGGCVILAISVVMLLLHWQLALVVLVSVPPLIIISLCLLYTSDAADE